MDTDTWISDYIEATENENLEPPNGNTSWLTMDGVKIRRRDMSRKHIINCLRILTTSKARKSEAFLTWSHGILPTFKLFNKCRNNKTVCILSSNK